MDPQQKEAWYNYHKARTVQLVKDIKNGKIKTQRDILLRRWRHYMEAVSYTHLSPSTTRTPR